MSSLKPKARYGLREADWPGDFRKEINDILRWKQDDFAPGRPRDDQLSSTSADKLRRFICQLAGYAVNVYGVGLTTVRCLVAEDVVNSFCAWSINERRKSGTSFKGDLSSLYAAIRDYHKYKSLDLSWFPALLKSIPLVSETESLDRKVARMLPYSDIKQIPGKISLARKELAGREPKELAALVRDELLMTWLLLLPWRQRNLRECRIGGPNPNLFKAPLPKSSLVARPVWVRDIEAANPNACFWQFRFSEKETKMGNRVHAVLPRQLCGLLEGYLREHRNHLLSGSDPQTLFVNYKGRAFTRPLMTSRVSTLAMRFAGGKMSPHVFRDAFAHEWLTTHPDDYLTVSKLLWHRNIQTTLKIYGAQFNESSAVCRLDEWLEASAART